eukprot:scaffold2325_cov257-Pinguiococcus_pyrenoidosus.AAC.6
MFHGVLLRHIWPAGHAVLVRRLAGIWLLRRLPPPRQRRQRGKKHLRGGIVIRAVQAGHSGNGRHRSSCLGRLVTPLLGDATLLPGRCCRRTHSVAVLLPYEAAGDEVLERLERRPWGGPRRVGALGRRRVVVWSKQRSLLPVMQDGSKPFEYGQLRPARVVTTVDTEPMSLGAFRCKGQDVAAACDKAMEGGRHRLQGSSEVSCAHELGPGALHQHVAVPDRDVPCPHRGRQLARGPWRADVGHQ